MENTLGGITLATLKDVLVPDLGGVSNATVIEILVKPGDQVTSADSLITLESDKASMEIPSPYNGTIKTIKLKMGDKLSQGNIIAQMEVTEAASEKAIPQTSTPPTPTKETAQAVTPPPAPTPAATKPSIEDIEPACQDEVHAGPAVRRLARELGVNLNEITGSGPKTRILKEDVEAYVKSAIAKAKGGPSYVTSNIDFSQFAIHRCNL